MKSIINGSIEYSNGHGPSRIGMPACFLQREIQWAYNGKFHRMNGFTKYDFGSHYSDDFFKKSVLYGWFLKLNATKLVI